MENENVTVRASLLDNIESEDRNIQGMKYKLSTWFSPHLRFVINFCTIVAMLHVTSLFQSTAERTDVTAVNIHMKKQYLVSVSKSEV